MSFFITYHSLAIDCYSDLQRSTGVIVGMKVCGKEGGGHGSSDTGLRVSLVVSTSMLHIRKREEFGPWSVSRDILDVNETSPLAFRPFALWPPLWPN